MALHNLNLPVASEHVGLLSPVSEVLTALQHVSHTSRCTNGSGGGGGV